MYQQLSQSFMLNSIPYLTILALIVPEVLSNNTRKAYVEAGKKWSTVIITSLLVALATVSLFMITIKPTELYDIILISFVGGMTYTFIQSLFTDIAVKKFNRKVLRVGMLLSMGALAYIMKTNSFDIDVKFAVLSFTILSLIMLVFAPLFGIGVSDGRVMLMTYPLLAAINPQYAYYSFFLGMLLGILFREMKTRELQLSIRKDLRAIPENSELSNASIRKIARAGIPQFKMAFVPFLMIVPLIFMVIVILT